MQILKTHLKPALMILAAAATLSCAPQAQKEGKENAAAKDKKTAIETKLHGPAITGLSILDDPDVKAATPLPDFSYAGYGFGLKSIPDITGTVIKAADYGVTPNDGLDDSQAMLDAIKAANAVVGPVVLQMPAGKIQITEILKIERGDFVLRGAGSGKNGTEFHFPRPLKMVDDSDTLAELREYLIKYDKRQKEPAQNINYYFTEYTWTGGFIWVQKPGTRPDAYLEELDLPDETLANIVSGEFNSRTVSVDTAEKLNVGDVLQIIWYNRVGENGPMLREIYGDTDLKIGSHHWSFPNRGLVNQRTRITAINGNQVTIGDPLLHNISDELPAEFANWEHMENVGIEDISITFPNAPSYGHHLEEGFNGIYFTSVFDGWIRNVNITNADSGILTYNSASSTISDVQVFGERAGHYAVHIGNVHNFLVKDLNVFNKVVHALTVNTRATKGVFLRAEVFKQPVLDQHAGSNHQNLFDNVTLHVNAKRDENGPYFPVWDGSGAGYWQPGHGRYNATWNLKVIIEDGALRGETVRLDGIAEGPNARIVGVHGNRDFTVNYYPEPYIEALNAPMDTVPSLYEWQLAQRRE